MTGKNFPHPVLAGPHGASHGKLNILVTDIDGLGNSTSLSHANFIFLSFVLGTLKINFMATSRNVYGFFCALSVTVISFPVYLTF